MQSLIALIAGLIFGSGLVLSEMINPRRVLGFLDVAGAWDPTLLFVMAGALAVAAPGFWFARRRERPVLARGFSWPTRRDIDRSLIGGAVLFGIGWGLAGFCPGPAITALTIGGLPVLIFVAAMVMGMALANGLAARTPLGRPG
jgi:uncharacterized membrane protein YedE/YeeE